MLDENTAAHHLPAVGIDIITGNMESPDVRNLKGGGIRGVSGR